MKKTKNGTLSASQKTSIELREYGPPASISLSSQEYDILSKYFGKCLEITLDKTRSTLNNYICSIKAKDYIGNINLPSLMLRINPKIKKLNINYMIPLAYDLEPFKESDFGYLLEKESTLFELLVKKLSDIIEKLCKRGIIKTYYENDENLPYVKGKILSRENLIHNSILRHRAFCRYIEFGPDNTLNRIVKYTLYHLILMHLEESYLSRKLRFLLQYFEPVSLQHFDPHNDFLKITYSRLTIQYKPIIDLCKLILAKSSVNLSSTGKIQFSSFLVDMNELFDFVIYRILSLNLNRNLTVQGGKKKIRKKIDIEKVTPIKPDIVIREVGGGRSVVIDAKYEEKYEPSHLYQIWTYAIGLRIPVGVLVYPKNKSIENYQTTLKTTMTPAHILTIDLTKPDPQNFLKECKEFVVSVERIMGE